MAYFKIDVCTQSILIQINIPQFVFGERESTKYYDIVPTFEDVSNNTLEYNTIQ